MRHSPRWLIGGITALLFFVSCSTRQPEGEGTVTVTFWHSFVSSTAPALDTLLAGFHKEFPEIRVRAQYVPTGDGLIQKLAIAIQSGTAPDICWIHPDFLSKLVEAEAIYPLEEFLSGDDGLSDSALQDIFPPLLEACTEGGVIYSLPMEATSLALLWNRELFQNAGLDPDRPPADWDELSEYTRRLTIDFESDGRIDQYGFFVPVFPASGELNIWMTLQWLPFLWQAGGVEFRPDRSEAVFNSTAGVRALTLWKTLYDEIDFRSFGIAHDLGFASAKLAMIMDGPWNLPRYRALKDLDWSVGYLPAGPTGRATYLGGEQLVIFRQSRHPIQAWRFIRWVQEPEVQARFSMNSGYLPVRRSVLALKEYQTFLESDPALRVFVKQMSIGRVRQSIDRHRMEINRALAEAIERATLGTSDPKRCLDEAVAKANVLLKSGK